MKRLREEKEGCDYGFWPWLLGPFMGLCPALAGFIEPGKSNAMPFHFSGCHGLLAIRAPGTGNTV